MFSKLNKKDIHKYNKERKMKIKENQKYINEFFKNESDLINMKNNSIEVIKLDKTNKLYLQKDPVKFIQGEIYNKNEFNLILQKMNLKIIDIEKRKLLNNLNQKIKDFKQFQSTKFIYNDFKQIANEYNLIEKISNISVDNFLDTNELLRKCKKQLNLKLNYNFNIYLLLNKILF